MKIYDVLKSLGIPCAYGMFKDRQNPPFIVYLGNGQDQFHADDTVYSKTNLYQCEYYFKKKDEDEENEIEEAFLENGYIYSKSEDVFVEDENVFVIYYDVWEKQNG